VIYGDTFQSLKDLCESTAVVDLSCSIHALRFDGDIQSFAAALAEDSQLDKLRYCVEEAPKFGNIPVNFAADHFSVLHQAVQAQQVEIVRYIFEEAPKFGQPKVEFHDQALTWLQTALYIADTTFLKYLIEEAPKYLSSTSEKAELSRCRFSRNSSYSAYPHFRTLKYAVSEALKFDQRLFDLRDLQPDELLQLKTFDLEFYLLVTFISENWEVLRLLDSAEQISVLNSLQVSSLRSSQTRLRL
jgi:hypothetical protein